MPPSGKKKAPAPPAITKKADAQQNGAGEMKLGEKPLAVVSDKKTPGLNATDPILVGLGSGGNRFDPLYALLTGSEDWREWLLRGASTEEEVFDLSQSQAEKQMMSGRIDSQVIMTTRWHARAAVGAKRAELVAGAYAANKEMEAQRPRDYGRQGQPPDDNTLSLGEKKK